MRQRILPALRWSLRQKGLAGTFSALARALHRRLSGSRQDSTCVHPFDMRYGTDTSGLIGGGRLAVGSRSDAHIVAYAGVPPSRFAESLRRWSAGTEQPRPEEFTFVDLGCGKGRALMLASEHPFREVVGIEINPELTAIAKRNLALWQQAGRSRTAVSLLNEDATRLRLPEGNCLIFLYNSFGPPVTRDVMRSIEEQKRTSAGELYILYQNESETTPLRNDSRLTLVWSAQLAQSDEDREADPVSSPKDVTSLYRWAGPNAC